jgi:hypothetical protein
MPPLAGPPLPPSTHTAGYVRIDQRLNSQLYGDGAAPAEILRGGVALPAEFQPLLESVEAAAMGAEVGRGCACGLWAVGCAARCNLLGNRRAAPCTGRAPSF